MALDSNEKSNFQARELKSVYVDQVTLLLKIVFHKCYVNKYNLYNQVGLVAVNCMGELYSPGGPTQMEVSKAPVTDLNLSLAMTGPNLEDEMNIDKNTLETIRELYKKKELAVSKDDFDEAKRLKMAIDRIKAVS